ncbi:DciA family protein [Streptomyces sp. NPDC001455]|uniref:DciA family protein n=1 Tax=Streptomyces sp. NPDC001455 TaxID=3154518 RepID=UPI00333401D1
MMMTERGLVAPAAGTLLDQWETILTAAAPELAGHVRAVGFDTDTGRLDVAPEAPAYGTKLRWITPKLIAAANEQVQGANVRAVHVLAPAPTKAGLATAVADPAPQPTVPAVTVVRRTPPEGYRRAIEAHRQAARPLADPGIAEAVERQTAAMRELSRRVPRARHRRR